MLLVLARLYPGDVVRVQCEVATVNIQRSNRTEVEFTNELKKILSAMLSLQWLIKGKKLTEC